MRMWFKRKPKQVVHGLSPEIQSTMDTITQLMRQFISPPVYAPVMPSFSSMLPRRTTDILTRSPEEIEAEKKETTEVDAFITKMEPEIKTQTEALIKEEIRDMLLLGGNRQRILALLRAGKTPRLVRKKEGRRDPLFLQFGDGVADPIEEMQILG
jgi:hypothetical protein